MKPVYEADDGSTHATPEAAKKWEEILGAREDLERANRRAVAALAENAKTADGFPFEFGLRDYWLVMQTFGGMPRLREISVYHHEAMIDINRTDGQLVVRLYMLGARGVPDQYQTFGVGELYHKKANALQALITAQEQAVAEFTEQLVRLKKEVAEGKHR